MTPAYAARKRREGYGSRILTRTGHLRISLTNSRHPDFVYRPQKLSVEIGTRVPYAQYHQRGTRKMPKREPIRLTQGQVRFWIRLINAFIHREGQKQRVNL